MTADLAFYKNKNIFITGHTGFKGAWLITILKMAGAEITGYSLNPPTDPALFDLIKQDGINSVIGDIRDYEKLKQVFDICKPEIVIHMSAQPLVLRSYMEPRYTYETNVMGTVNILEVIRLSNFVKSFVNVTTDKVYHNKEWLWGYREHERLCGDDPYSNSKSCSELVTYSYKQSFFKNESSPAISTTRSGNVIGGGDFAENRIIPDCIRFAEKQEDIILRNPDSVRPYQHVLECLSGYLLLAQKQYEDKDKYAGCYNFGPDESGCVSTGELVSIFCEKWGKGQKWIHIGENQHKEASFLKLDPSLSKSLLKHENKWGIETAVEKCVDWAKEYLAGGNFNEVMNRQIKEYFSI